MPGPLRLLTVHAHPDDESSKGAATVAKYADDGVAATLVCCTGGEEGDVVNKAMDRPDVRDRLPAVRRRELEQAAAIIGYQSLHWLGYRDSGMENTPANDHPECFARAPMDEAIGRLVRIIRLEQPHVVVTYSDDQQGYRHPDHLRVHDISVPAFELASDPGAYPEAGAPWRPSKLYYTVWSRARIHALHDKYLELGLDSPYDEKWFTRPSTDHRITTRVEVGRWYHRRSEALRAHATQVDPQERVWFGLADEHAADAYPYDDYVLAECTFDAELPEADLFAGLRAERLAADRAV